MDFLNSLLSPVINLNWEVIAQLSMVAMIIVAGPAVIFLLAARGGDL